ncbi:MAG: peptidase M23 [Gallionellales bacterium RIFCSPLOWO2_12_FULL_59_22]|nr:MAG: peptidase M23 [Gallionellales bacterium RIFCSPLOWO2_02_FULL_59_110]OGT05557.1 MAG: peptidase M23 [Gallionellales bacterium RIFCSPLOWO2_02_58_13]OGT14274.1 MAG: peptidase M23 [Gallionellales bacterium RIFCSPLOWO2_12_FULL_59_22]
MNVILVSSRLAKSRSITLGGWQVLFLLLLFSWLVWVAAFALQYTLVRFAPEGLSDGVRTLLSKIQSEEQQKQQSYVHNSLDAMAARVGQMQAQMQRLDALGARLAKLTGMKPEEFRFDEPPAQGGPLITIPAQEMSVNGLEQQLNRLTQAVNDRGDKLLALETMLLQNQLSHKLLPSIKPVVEGFYSSNFGWRPDPFTGKNAMHEGVDFMVNAGTPILASAGGVVAYADLHPQYGNMVEVDHGNDIVTRYAHASRLLVKVGQVVRRGEKVAEVGSTGRSTGNHLHFEVRYKGIAQNPVRFLQKTAG